jgi:hypothetical protein
MGGKRDDTYPDPAAFVEKLQSGLTLARKLLIAAQQRQKAYADQHRIEKSYSVGDQVLLSTKYPNVKHGKTNRKLLPKMGWSIQSRAEGGSRLLQVRDESRLACASCISRLSAGAV